MATITVTPNQTMGDVVIQAMGTLEGGMVFCSLNGVAIGDTPAVGTMYEIPDGTQPTGIVSGDTLIAFNSDTMTDSGVLQYLGQNGIVIGNLSNVEGVFITEDGSEDFETEGGGESFIAE